MVSKRIAAAAAAVNNNDNKSLPNSSKQDIENGDGDDEEVAAVDDDDGDDDDDDDDDESSDGEPIITMLEGREKRFNAGNRMRALLDEESTLLVEEEFKEETNDDEFIGKDEEDVFDSDFGSTDEGSAQEEDEETRIEREAKEARREARGKKKKATHTPFLPSFARQTKTSRSRSRNAVGSTSRATLDDDGVSSPRKKQKVAHTVTDGMTPRESSRKSAVAFKQTVEERLKETEQRRLSLPKQAKKITRVLTQADLISEALETEDINRASLLAFYAAEEDRLATERLAGMRYEISGPKLTFLSRSEGGARGTGIAVVEIAKAKGKEKQVVRSEGQKAERGRKRLIEVIGEAGKQGWRSGIDPIKEAGTVGAVASSSSNGGSFASTSTLPLPRSSAATASNGYQPSPLSNVVTSSSSSDIFAAVPSPLELHSLPPRETSPTSPQSRNHHSPTMARILLTSDDQTMQSAWFAPPSPPLQESPPTANLATSSSSSIGTLPFLLPPIPSSSTSSTVVDPPVAPSKQNGKGRSAVDREEQGSHTRNYLILSEFEGSQSEEMAALFGDHHAWGSVKVVPNRARVLQRKTPVCSITGLPSLYRDPRTMTPYATIDAYKQLTILYQADQLRKEPARIANGEGSSSAAIDIKPETIGETALTTATKATKGTKVARVAKVAKVEKVAKVAKVAKLKTVSTTPTPKGLSKSKSKKKGPKDPSLAPLSRSTSLLSTLPPLPPLPPAPMMTTMQAGQAVLGVGGQARARKNLQKAEKERLLAVAALEEEGKQNDSTVGVVVDDAASHAKLSMQDEGRMELS